MTQKSKQKFLQFFVLDVTQKLFLRIMQTHYLRA